MRYGMNLLMWTDTLDDEMLPLLGQLKGIGYDAVEILVDKKISELPVIDTDGRAAGMIDVTDVVGWLPADAPSAESEEPSRPDDFAGPQTVPFPG